MRESRVCTEKVMWFGANLAHALHHAKDYGFDVKVDGFNWTKLVTKRENLIGGITDWYENSFLADNGIELITGAAQFVDARTLVVNGATYTADHIVIATGSRPIFPKDIEGLS